MTKNPEFTAENITAKARPLDKTPARPAATSWEKHVQYQDLAEESEVNNIAFPVLILTSEMGSLVHFPTEQKFGRTGCENRNRVLRRRRR